MKVLFLILIPIKDISFDAAGAHAELWKECPLVVQQVKTGKFYLMWLGRFLPGMYKEFLLGFTVPNT